MTKLKQTDIPAVEHFGPKIWVQADFPVLRRWDVVLPIINPCPFTPNPAYVKREIDNVPIDIDVYTPITESRQMVP
jgi:hypothetical protein